MANYKTFRECISDHENELLIFAADNFSQFPRRTSFVTSKCDKTLPVAQSHDLVVLRSTLDHEYHNWLRSFGLGSDLVLEYNEDSVEKTLSELIIDNPEPVLEIISKTGRKPIYIPWYSSDKENEAAKVLGAELFGATGSESLKYNDKASFKIICQQLGIPVVEGVSFEMLPQNGENYHQMKKIIKDYLLSFDTVIIRGTLGESGMSLYKTKGTDIAEIYLEISNSGEKVIIIEPFLNVSSSPNDQWIISRDSSIHHVGTREQVCKDGLIHTGTIKDAQISGTILKNIKKTSLKIVNKMAETGYKGVVGIDYIVSDKGLFPVENNARFNGSSYVSLIVDNIEKLISPIPYWKFLKIKTSPCSFLELKERLNRFIYNGVRENSIFPYNTEALADTGNFNVILLTQDMDKVFELEQIVKKLEISKDISN